MPDRESSENTKRSTANGKRIAANGCSRRGRAHAGDDRTRHRPVRIAKVSSQPHYRRAAQVSGSEGGRIARPREKVARIPYFCSGCPHNTSHNGAGRQARRGRNRLPLHGHMDTSEETMTFTQMGGEGVPWNRHSNHSPRPSTFSLTWRWHLLSFGPCWPFEPIASKVNIPIRFCTRCCSDGPGASPWMGRSPYP